MNLLLIGVLLALVAIAYQLGLRKSRHLAGKGSNRRHYILVLVIMAHWLGFGAVSLLFNFDHLELG